MRSNAGASGWKTQLVLYPVFAVTGMAHVVGGALMPSIAATFHLSDSQSGTLFLLYFGGSALGALLCRGSYSRILWIGFLVMTVCSVGVAYSPAALLPFAFLLLGISVGIPMSAVSLYVGRNIIERRAAFLTLLNFTWSCGALISPLLAGRILDHHSYRTVYLVIAASAFVSAIVCALALRDGHELEADAQPQAVSTVLRLILIFALAAFLQVGIENTSAAWLTTFAMRTSGSGMVVAAFSTSFYWAGFLVSRGASSFLLLTANVDKVLRTAVGSALCAAVLLVTVPDEWMRSFAMLLLGATLAPIYPLILDGFFARARHSGDSRWILATAGFGGSVLPWIAGSLSSLTASLRLGMMVIPVALLLLAAELPAMRGRSQANLAR